MKIILSPLSLLKLLLSLIGALLIAHIISVAFKLSAEDQLIRGLGMLFDFDREANVPSAFSTFLLATSSGLLYFIYRNSNSDSGWYRTIWFLLSIVFLFLACDEIASIHERLTPVVRERYNVSGLLYFGWMLPYAIGTTLLGLVLIPFLLRLHARIRMLFLVAGLIYISGAIGFNALGGQEAEQNGYFSVLYTILYTFEELFEMVGIALFIYALAVYILEHLTFQKITLKIRRD